MGEKRVAGHTHRMTGRCATGVGEGQEEESEAEEEGGRTDEGGEEAEVRGEGNNECVGEGEGGGGERDQEGMSAIILVSARIFVLLIPLQPGPVVRRRGCSCRL
jgi:hypothetical protein